jgi:HrpA-like RNA helicase
MEGFWVPGEAGPGGEEDGPLHLWNPLASLSIARQRAALPVAALRDMLLYAVRTRQVTVVTGATGCGKTTQIPQFLLEVSRKSKHEKRTTLLTCRLQGGLLGQRVVAVAQPRRIAALSVAKRIAEEQESVLGEGSVGYSVRFGNSSCDATRILLCTDGMLLRELLSDPLLTRYAVVMVDEAHEKSLESDLLLALLKKVLAVRRDLRVVVCSATLNVAEFERFFSLQIDDSLYFTPAVIHVPARQFPVDILYLRESCADYVAATVAAIEDIHAREPPGDVLAFLAGREEIETAMRLLRRRSGHGGYALLPCALHGSLSLENQVFFCVDFSVFLFLILSFVGAGV